MMHFELDEGNWNSFWHVSELKINQQWLSWKFWWVPNQFQTHRWGKKDPIWNQQGKFEIHSEFWTHPLSMRVQNVFNFKMCASCSKQVERLSHSWWRLVTTRILNRGIMKSMATIIPLVKFDICSLELVYVN